MPERGLDGVCDPVDGHQARLAFTFLRRRVPLHRPRDEQPEMEVLPRVARLPPPPPVQHPRLLRLHHPRVHTVPRERRAALRAQHLRQPRAEVEPGLLLEEVVRANEHALPPEISVLHDLPDHGVHGVVQVVVAFLRLPGARERASQHGEPQCAPCPAAPPSMTRVRNPRSVRSRANARIAHGHVFPPGSRPGPQPPYPGRRRHRVSRT